MATTSEALAIAVGHHQAGRLPAAEEIYRQILTGEPRHAQAWHLLGVVQYQRCEHAEAARSIGRAIELEPAVAAFHCNLGNAQQALGEPAPAAASYRRALELNPNHAEAHNNLGIVLQAQGQRDEAIACYRRVLALRPDYAQAHNNLGLALQEADHYDEALASFCRALELAPNYAEAHYNLGNILREDKRTDSAIECYRQAVALQPGLYQAHNNLGSALLEQKKVDEAEACIQRALELAPNYAEAHNNLGNVCLEQGKHESAIACYVRALELNPDYAQAHYNLGNALQELKQRDGAIEQQGDAIACYRRALELKPDYAEAYYNLGHILREQGKFDEAADCSRHALEYKPDFPLAVGSLVQKLQHMCDWPEVPELSWRVIEIVEHDAEKLQASLVSPFSFIVLPISTTAEQQMRCARQWARWQLKIKEEKAGTFVGRRQASNKSRLKIGYLSADFHPHATAMLIAEMFEKHDHTRFEIVGYSYGPHDEGPMRQRLVQAMDGFVEMKSLSHEEAAELIAADEVDILVDLKGYTQNARTEILAYRPAPIQVNYLGYPGTMGADFMDYILVDDFIVPADQQPFFTERLVHLPGCYQVNDSQRVIAEETPSRAECGLPEQGFVFCSFNSNYKITSEMFDVWMRLLQAVEGSVLWLFEGNRFAPRNLRAEAEARGVDPQRLVFAPYQKPPEHLARHRLADLFLDSLPVNAHTTASDALWAGCPVLTIAGETFVSRVAGSLLRTLGLPELITTNLADYEALALRLARDPQKLAELRARLQANRATSSLFDAEHFARHVEQAYTRMWEIYQAGEQPRGFAIEASPPTRATGN